MCSLCAAWYFQEFRSVGTGFFAVEKIEVFYGRWVCWDDGFRRSRKKGPELSFAMVLGPWFVTSVGVSHVGPAK